jgi:hypothetical protein
MDGYITVTPLQLDRAHRPSLKRLERWDFIGAPQR